MAEATAAPEAGSQTSPLDWAVERHAPASLSFAAPSGWVNLQATVEQFDGASNTLRIAVPREGRADGDPLPNHGDQIGVSFRRGHKKCLLLATVMLAHPGTGQGTELLLRVPSQVRTLQRRAYQRVNIPDGVFIAAKVWEGGVPVDGAVAWPVCSGRVSNISMGGVLIETQADQNPKLSSGELVGVEITIRPGVSLLLDGMYRHCEMDNRARIGLGFHFQALEHELPGRSKVADLADFVNRIRKM